MVKFSKRGNLKKTLRFLNKTESIGENIDFSKYGEAGIKALSLSTPSYSGKTSNSWRYKIIKEDGKTKIQFLNDNVNHGVNIAIIIDRGHATKNGTWVEGYNYIEPTLIPIFDSIKEDIIREVSL